MQIQKLESPLLPWRQILANATIGLGQTCFLLSLKDSYFFDELLNNRKIYFSDLTTDCDPHMAHSYMIMLSGLGMRWSSMSDHKVSNALFTLNAGYNTIFFF